MIGFWADEAFAAKVDAARKKEGASSRSQWVRAAIASKLIAAGYDVSVEEQSAPDRTGKGGPVIYRIRRGSHTVLNQKPSSKPGSSGKRVLKKAVGSEPPVDPK